MSINVPKVGSKIMVYIGVSRTEVIFLGMVVGGSLTLRCENPSTGEFVAIPYWEYAIAQ